MKGDLRDGTLYRVLDKRDYIGYPADDAQLVAVIAGDRPADLKIKRVRSGETTSDIPACTAPWMLKAGWICVAGSAADPYGSPVEVPAGVARTKGKAEATAPVPAAKVAPDVKAAATSASDKGGDE